MQVPGRTESRCVQEALAIARALKAGVANFQRIILRSPSIANGRTQGAADAGAGGRDDVRRACYLQSDERVESSRVQSALRVDMQVPEGNANNSPESPVRAGRVEPLCAAEGNSGVAVCLYGAVGRVRDASEEEWIRGWTNGTETGKTVDRSR